MSASRKPLEMTPPRLGALARLPVFFALAGKRAVLVGGGQAAAWKLELLEAAGAQVQVYAVDQWSADDLRGAAIAVGAFDTDAEAKRFCDAARAAGVPVNVIDKPALLRLLLRRHRQPLAAGDRHLDRRRGAGVRAGDPRQARGAAAERLCRLGLGRRALARCGEGGGPAVRRPAQILAAVHRARDAAARQRARPKRFRRLHRRGERPGRGRRERLGHAGRRRSGRSRVADVARRARAAIRRHHLVRRSRVRTTCSTSPAARRARCWSARPATARPASRTRSTR